MKRPLIFASLLVFSLVGAIVLKLQAQDATLSGPPGGSGVVEGTELKLAAQLSARVERIAVKKGQRVKRGELLLSLDCADVEATIAEAKARVQVAEAQAQSATANKHAAQRSVGIALAQASATKSRGEAIETRRAIAERNAARLTQAGSGVTAASLDQSDTEARALAIEQRAALDTTRASTAQAGVASAQSHAAAAAEVAAVSSVEAAKSSLGRAQLLARECQVVAPRDGFIEELFVEEGELTGRGSTLVRLVDIDEVTVTFYLPNAELGAVSFGQKATVLVDAYPGERFEGLVSSVATEAAFTPRNIQTRTDRDRLVFPIEVRLPNRQHRLRPGMPAEVRLVVR